MTFTPPDQTWVRVAKVTRVLLVPFLLSLATAVGAQAIPDGTIIPVQLNSSLDSGRVMPGREFTARVMQDVPGTPIHAGNKVVGRVVSAKPAADGKPGQLTLQFDSVRAKKQSIAISTDLRALASMMEVEEAQVPLQGPDRGTPPEDWTTVQVGGEVVYRGGGPVANGMRDVGVPTANGVLVHVSAVASTKCRGGVDNNDREQALWVFSSNACGVYGYSNLEIIHAGRSQPVGQIILASQHGKVRLQGGSGMLLRVNKLRAQAVPEH